MEAVGLGERDREREDAAAEMERRRRGFALLVAGESSALVGKGVGGRRRMRLPETGVQALPGAAKVKRLAMPAAACWRWR